MKFELIFYFSLFFLFLRFFAMFGSSKVLRKEKKNVKKNDFFMFGFTIKNIKKNKI